MKYSCYNAQRGPEAVNPEATQTANAVVSAERERQADYTARRTHHVTTPQPSASSSRRVPVKDREVYRKVYLRLWRHPGFRCLSDAEKVLALYMLSGPQTNQIGCYYFSPALAAEDLGASRKLVTRQLRGVAEMFGWEWREAAHLFYIPSWLAWNRPNGVNATKGWQAEAEKIHDPMLKRCLLDAIGMPSARRNDAIFTQDQEQDQYQDQKKEIPPTPQGGSAFDDFWKSYPRKVGKEAARKAFGKCGIALPVLLEALGQQQASAQWQREGGRFVPHPATWLNQGRWQDEPEPQAQELPVSDEEFALAAEIRRKAWGRCPHEPACADNVDCVRLIALERRTA